MSRGTVANLEGGSRLTEGKEAKVEAALGKPVGWLDSLRAIRVADPPDDPSEGATEPATTVDPTTATLADVTREYAYFMTVLDTTDMERLYRLNEMYHQLQVRLYGHEEGDRSHA